MSDYKRGKVRVYLWASHWDAVADEADRNTTIEAKMVEYHTNLRKAFQTPSEPNVLIMTPSIKQTHLEIMELPAPQREHILVWHFGDDDERREAYGDTKREPSPMKAIYQKLGRYHRGARKNN